MIKGLGADLVEKKRVEIIFSKYGNKFVERILTLSERQEFLKRKGRYKKISFLSNNFVSKEATSKALGTGFSKGITLKSIEVLRKDNGYPYLRLFGEAKKKALKGGYESFNLSISDTKEHSLALVVVEGE